MKAIYAFGVLGFFIALLIALFIFKWINDRRSGSQRIT
jgi:predicted PurR-regulated permease PerM